MNKKPSNIPLKKRSHSKTTDELSKIQGMDNNPCRRVKPKLGAQISTLDAPDNDLPENLMSNKEKQCAKLKKSGSEDLDYRYTENQKV